MIEDWYSSRSGLHEELLDVLKNAVEGLLRANSIQFVSVSGRVKSLAGIVEKVRRKAYSDLNEQLTDVLGMRIILYRESDVRRVCSLMESTFRIHRSDSVDKSDALGADRFGYRSVHYVCDLGAERVSLPEYSKFGGVKFEVQVRTVLQHAWAEIEHDKGYKLGVALPTQLKRRLALVAGLLELADRELDAISENIDTYAAKVTENLAKGDLTNELDVLSVVEFINKRASEKGIVLREVNAPSWPRAMQEALEELKDFGVRTVQNLSDLLSDDILKNIYHDETGSTWVGLVRDVMMYRDIDKYFNDAWKRHWGISSTEREDNLQQWLSKRYGSAPVEKWFRRVEAEYASDDDEDITDDDF